MRFVKTINVDFHLFSRLIQCIEFELIEVMINIIEKIIMLSTVERLLISSDNRRQLIFYRLTKSIYN